MYDRGSGEDGAAVAELEAAHSLRCGVAFRGLEDQVDDLGLLDEQVLLALEDLAHLDAVELLVAPWARSSRTAGRGRCWSRWNWTLRRSATSS